MIRKTWDFLQFFGVFDLSGPSKSVVETCSTRIRWNRRLTIPLLVVLKNEFRIQDPYNPFSVTHHRQTACCVSTENFIKMKKMNFSKQLLFRKFFWRFQKSGPSYTHSQKFVTIGQVEPLQIVSNSFAIKKFLPVNYEKR